MKYYTFVNFLKRSIAMDMYLHFGQKNVFLPGLNELMLFPKLVQLSGAMNLLVAQT